MAVRIEHVRAVEILDSYGRPALDVRTTLAGGATGSARVGSGPHPHPESAAILCAAMRELVGVPFDGLADLDDALRKLDGAEPGPSPERQAIMGVSIAAARAMAAARGVRLWRLLASPGAVPRLPVPHFTMVNGGSPAGTALDFEEFMIVPVGAPTVREAMRAGTEIRRRLRGVLSGLRLTTQVGGDGGFVPEIEWPERVLELLTDAVGDAGYALGAQGVAIALRVAASGFRDGDAYQVAGERLSSTEMVARLEQMAADFPVWSIEDGLAHDDWDGWADLTRRLGDRVQLVGGDVFDTRPEPDCAGARTVANAALIRIARCGSVTEALDVVRACREAGYAQVLAHHGDTCDSFVADLAVATGCGQLKAGAPTQGERVTTYNRLIEIEEDDRLAYGI
jgi:enolase